MGLPPRGRGRVKANRPTLSTVGITPAWAGKSQYQQYLNGEFEDYPRVGGEEKSELCNYAAAYGLPPRGRGRGWSAHAGLLRVGITPAWAGKRLSINQLPFLSADYPRVGGEEPSMRRRTRWPAGLPPRGRGRVPFGDARRGVGGITPAWAGKRIGDGHPADVPEDYPRVGGEELSGTVTSISSWGLPPRGRGRGCRVT